MLVEIDNKLCRDIQDWCEQVNMPINEYIESVLRMDLSLRKYGDLNEKVGKKQKETKKEETVVATAPYEVDMNVPTIVHSEGTPANKEINAKYAQVDKDIVEPAESDTPKEEEPQPKQTKKKQRIINIH
jgi:hypothetical protein